MGREPWGGGRVPGSGQVLEDVAGKSRGEGRAQGVGRFGGDKSVEGPGPTVTRASKAGLGDPWGPRSGSRGKEDVPFGGSDRCVGVPKKLQWMVKVI